jgi:hypothetical protein
MWKAGNDMKWDEDVTMKLNNLSMETAKQCQTGSTGSELSKPTTPTINIFIVVTPTEAS